MYGSNYKLHLLSSLLLHTTLVFCKIRTQCQNKQVFLISGTKRFHTNCQHPFSSLKIKMYPLYFLNSHFWSYCQRSLSIYSLCIHQSRKMAQIKNVMHLFYYICGCDLKMKNGDFPTTAYTLKNAGLFQSMFG